MNPAVNFVNFLFIIRIDFLKTLLFTKKNCYILCYHLFRSSLLNSVLLSDAQSAQEQLSTATNTNNTTKNDETSAKLPATTLPPMSTLKAYGAVMSICSTSGSKISSLSSLSITLPNAINNATERWNSKSNAEKPVIGAWVGILLLSLQFVKTILLSYG